VTLIFPFVAEIVEILLFTRVSLRFHPELRMIIEPTEDIQSFSSLLPEDILLRWFNFHLKEAKKNQIANFTGDLKVSFHVIINF
jgi:plastin-1